MADAWGERNRANPADAAAAINYVQALRANGQRAQAVLEQASIHSPGNKEDGSPDGSTISIHVGGSRSGGYVLVLHPGA
jgi:hypothetical protein